jgi:hypothetical protein
MGVVTDQFSTNSHSAIRYGIMGALMDQIQIADLNIVDAIWINANPNSGPQTSYAGATERDEIVASLDPIALDIWAVKNILIPGFLSNGYSPPWPPPSADPDIPTSAFRTYLDNSMNLLLASGHQVTNIYEDMDVRDGYGGAGDFDRDGAVDGTDYDRFASCYTGPGGGPVGSECDAADFDRDGDVDCDDWWMFQFVWTGPGAVPSLPECETADAPDVGSAGRGPALWPAAPNPVGEGTEIAYSIAAAGPVRLCIYDVGGRLVRTLVDRVDDAGKHSVRWDGRSDAGKELAPGVYTCQLQIPGQQDSQKLVIQ